MLHIKPKSLASSHSGEAEPRAVTTVARYRVSTFDGSALPALVWPGVADDATLDSYVYQSREFLTVWAETVGPARHAHLFLVTVETEHGDPVLWLPLAIEREFGCTVLRSPDGSMADYNAPILARGVAAALPIETLWDAILRTLPRVDLIDFVKMPETIWDQPNPMLRIGPTQRKDEGYYLPIVGTHADYLADPARKGRVRKLGQLFRKLGRSGTVHLGEVRDPADVAKARAFLEHHKTLQYTRTLGFSQFDQPGIRAFVDRLCEPAALEAFTRMTSLTLDGDVIGAQLDFITPRRQQGFMTTFDAGRHSFVSPGRQVQLHLIARAFADKLEIFDLGHGDNPYKHPWMTTALNLYSLEQARTLRGRAFLAARTVRRRLPAGLGAKVRAWLRPGASALREETARDEA
jgi:CelD/BcsL family acetyltransferase involved in cellulose biosynthesis